MNEQRGAQFIKRHLVETCDSQFRAAINYQGNQTSVMISKVLGDAKRVNGCLVSSA